MAERAWSPPWLVEQFFRLAPCSFARQVVTLLVEGDKILSEILEGFARFMHHFGHFREENVVRFTMEAFTAAVQEAIEHLALRSSRARPD